MIVAARGATLALPEVRYVFIPGSGGTQRLACAAGRDRAAESLSADETQTLGIVARQAEPGQAVAVALDIATRIAAHPPAAVTAARRAIREGVVMPLGAGLALERALTQPLTVSDTLRTRASAFVGLIGNPAQNT